MLNNNGDDYMEMANGWVPKANGWFYNSNTGNWMDENGQEFDKNMNPLETDDEFPPSGNDI